MYIYLASPYTHDDPAVMEKRFQCVKEQTACMLKSGLHVYSPIVHCHTMASQHNLPKDIIFWRAYNYAMLAPARSLHVLTLEGWRESIGVRDEIYFAIKHDIPITLL